MERDSQDWPDFHEKEQATPYTAVGRMQRNVQQRAQEERTLSHRPFHDPNGVEMEVQHSLLSRLFCLELDHVCSALAGPTLRLRSRREPSPLRRGGEGLQNGPSLFYRDPADHRLRFKGSVR